MLRILFTLVAITVPSFGAEFKLEVVFRGGDVSEGLRRVLEALRSNDTLPLKFKEVKAGERPVDVVRDRLDLPKTPGWEASVASIIRIWNQCCPNWAM